MVLKGPENKTKFNKIFILAYSGQLMKNLNYAAIKRAFDG